MAEANSFEELLLKCHRRKEKLFGEKSEKSDISNLGIPGKEPADRISHF